MGDKNSGKKELVGKDREARPLEPRGRKAGTRGSCALSGWRTEGVEGGSEPSRGLCSVWFLTSKYPSQDKPAGGENGLGRELGAQVRPTVP